MKRRPRRNRKSPVIRDLNVENRVDVAQLVFPLFVVDGTGVQKEVESLPGIFTWSLDTVLGEIKSCIQLGIKSFILFPKVDPTLKDKRGSYGYNKDNFYLNIAKTIKAEFPEVCLISDVALDPYSIDGHDGIVENGEILNDESLEVLQLMAIAQAEAGFDILGPSDMMDGRIGAIRAVLDRNGFTQTSIMSYTAKYASAFYGPFRDALDSSPVASSDVPKDKKTYQMNPSNLREAMIEANLDVNEGADFLMVKPAIHYLDVIHLLNENFDIPIAAYHVSGECAMLIAAAKNGWLDYDAAIQESLLSIKRAGANVIISYFAKQYAQMQTS